MSLIDYTAAGFVLVPIPRGTKGPTAKGWNDRARCVVPAGWPGNVGLAHAYSGTCALDIDDFDQARAWLAERGVDLDALWTAPEAVRISSGRPNRGKLLYRLATPLRSKKITIAKHSVIDFRCGTENGKTVQDVLPPSIHPDTGKPYEWQYGDELVGHWSSLPELPAAVHAIWAGLMATPEVPSERAAASASLEGLRTLLADHDPDADRDSWVRTLAAIHYETAGSEEGLDLADEWSARGKKYVSRADVETRWRSFHLNRANPVTVASLRVEKAAAVEEFEDLPEAPAEEVAPSASPADLFWAYMPDHRYIHRPTQAMWPAQSVDGKYPMKMDGNLRLSAWLDKHRAVEQQTWAPGQPEIIDDRVILEGELVTSPGKRIYNRYTAPPALVGDASQAEPWREHLARIYPEDATHIERWLAYKVQHPGAKVNHALVLGGSQGIGKDTMLEPAKRAVGAWNWSEVSPAQMLGSFNGWVKAVIVRVSEARDLGDVDRFAFYDHSKTYIAAPPDVLRVNEKHIREYPVLNVMGVILTTNHKTDGIYLPADDRRHYVAWSPAQRQDFDDDYWQQLWDWIEHGGAGHVAAYLRGLDLSGFDPKAPPPQTEAFHAIVQSSGDPGDAELASAIEELGRPNALTLQQLADHALVTDDAGDALLAITDPRERRKTNHRMDRCGYEAVRNPDAKSGMWRCHGKQQAIYCKKQLAYSSKLTAARALIRE